MNQFTLFSNEQVWERVIGAGVAFIILAVVALLLARLWAAAVTQVTDMIAEAIGDTLRGSGLWVALCLALIVGGVYFLPKAVSKSGETFASLWPTATPTPPPHWEVYFPVMARGEQGH